MRCARCGALIDPADNFCRQCGVTLRRFNLPTVVSRVLLPVPWTLAKGPVARGMAALVVGTVVELARREVTRRVTSVDPTPALVSLLPDGAFAPPRPRGGVSRGPRPQGANTRSPRPWSSDESGSSKDNRQARETA